MLQRDEPPRIPSLRKLLDGQADLPVEIPLTFPAETPKDDRINSPLLRYSDTGAHKNLHSNLPPSIMCFSNEPIPEVLSERTLKEFGPQSPFRHQSTMRDWVEGILTRGGHEKLVEFDTTVELAEKNDEGQWVLTLRKATPDSSTNSWWQESFDALVVATGHYYIPALPKIPGMADYDERFPGRIQHSKHYQSAEDYRGKVCEPVRAVLIAIVDDQMLMIEVESDCCWRFSLSV